METADFQKKCVEVVKTLDQKFGIDRSPQLSFTQLMEEIGELATDINSPALRHREADRDNMAGEFADVILQIMILAEMHGIEIEQAVLEKIAKLSDRHQINL